MGLRLTFRSAPKILDFDIENRPLTYLGSDYTTAEITAIAWSWYGEDDVECSQIVADRWGDETIASAVDMLLDFKEAYDEADMVTGHYIRMHDLPIINAGLMEYELPLLEAKLSSDTKLDLVKRKDLSMSQEALAEMYGLEVAKVHMTQPGWRQANRRTPEGIEKEYERVVGDVVQHKQLRGRLIDAGALRKPRIWRP